MCVTNILQTPKYDPAIDREVIMNPSDDGSLSNRDDTFKDDIVLFSDEIRGECEYVPSDHPTPDYRMLGSEQRDYFFYWRHCLSLGRCERTDEGYIWLRMCEIINSDMDYDRAVDELSLMHSSYGYVRNRDLLRSAIIDYALVNDRNLPRIWVWGWDARRHMALSEVMSSPPDPMELDFMVRLAGNPDVYYEDTDGLERLMNLVILRVDRQMILESGKGIEESFGKDARSDHTVYRGLKYFGESLEYSVSYTSLDNAEFRRFMLGLLRYCEQILFKRMNIRGPSAPSAFGNWMRKVADRALDDIMEGRGNDVRGPKPFRGTVRTPISSRERMLIEVGRETFGIDDPFSQEPEGRRGRMIVDLESRSQIISRSLKADMEAYRDDAADTECPYIPSGLVNPDYRSFDDDQRRFYIWWRGEVRAGRYPDTDSGYVWLHLCELINSESDPEDTLRSIGGMGKEYESEDDSHPLIRGTYLDYAAVNGLSDLDPSVMRTGATMCMALSSLLDGETRTISDKETLLTLGNLKGNGMREDFDDDCAGILCNVLRRIDSELGPSKDGIIGESMVYPKSVRVRPYSRLKYYGKLDPHGVYIQYWDFLGSERFTRDLNSVIKNVIWAVRRRKGKRKPVQRGKAFGIECSGIIESETDAWFSAGSLRPSAPIRDLEIDIDAVRDAESDLRSVTEMMRVDEGPDDAATVMPVKTSVPTDDPWRAFSSSLTDREVGYLRDCISGTARPDVRTEDSINTKALDSVGDVVMENGNVYEEYADDVERNLP